MEKDFVDWIWELLKEKGWLQAEISKRGNISPPQVSRVLNREQGAGIDFIKAVIDAFDLPPEAVLRHIGLLPEKTDIDPITERIIYIVKKLSIYDREEELAELEGKVERRQKRGNGRLSENPRETDA